MFDYLQEFQESCNNDTPIFCDSCSFFQGCKRKYTLKGIDKELCIVLDKVIILFPSETAYQNFCDMYSLTVNLLKLSEKEIENLVLDKNLEVITFN